MSKVEWFRSEWIESDVKALGVYIALLHARFCITGWWDEEIPEWFYRDVFETLKNFVKGEEFDKACKTAVDFLEKVHRFAELNRSKDILDEIEREYYEIFKRSYLKFVDKSALFKKIGNFNVLDFVKNVLDLAQIIANDSTPMGSVYLPIYNAKNYLKVQLWCEDYNRLRQVLKSSGIYIKDYIIPAPVFERDFIESLGDLEFVEKEQAIRDAISDVFKKLGFSVENIASGFLAIKRNEFYVYISYNWKDFVDEEFLSEEVNRISSIGIVPHLRVLICKGFKGNARDFANKNGFLTIELDLSEGSREEICKRIYRGIRETFVNLLLPDLRDALVDYSNKLKELAKGIEEIL